MTLIPDDLDAPLAPRDDDDEGLFSRDINGQLVRLDAPVESDYLKSVTLQVDGQTVTVPLAEPLKDAQGNIVLDLDGRTTPRYTTIYDAAVKLAESRSAQSSAAAKPPIGAPELPEGADPNPNTGRPADSTNMPIPVLCHQPHMNPVAVCRLCVVQIYGQKRGKRAAERKLFPACQHPVKENMEVFTMNAPGPDGERVRAAVKVMTELLTADHLKPAPAPAPAAELAPFNELQRIADRVGSAQSRFKLEVMTQQPMYAAPPGPATAAPNAAAIGATAGAPSAAGAGGAGVLNYFGPTSSWKGSRHGLDNSSPVFLVDHSACVLCDRCSRACVDVKGNNVIGRTGKGATAGIGFDLNDPMGESSCVQCGECMVSCPTSAITFKPVAKVKPRAEAHDSEIMTAAELVADPLFAGVPPKFLLWQEGLVVKRRVKPNEVLCRQGEPGNTAFLIKSGRLQVTGYPTSNGQGRRGLLGVLIGGRAPKPKPAFQVERGVEHFVLGEMACLSGTPRTADVTAIDAGEVWEMRRNVLDRLMRSPALRGKFEEIYRRNALDAVLRESEVFRGLPAEEYEHVINFLRPKLSFVRVNPLQVIFEQGDWADYVYLVRLGHVRIAIDRTGRDPVIVFSGPGSLVGETGLLAISPEDATKGIEEVKALVGAVLTEAGEELSAALPAARRNATCSALDHVELARVSRLDFLKMLRDFPTVRGRLIDLSLRRLQSSSDDDSPAVRAYIDQGLYQGQNLLVLDLQKCTRCDECTRACVQQHGTHTHGAPVTRLLRDGLRFGDFLVATSCRSCKDAYCMIGCPVDSIHRGKHRQIIIEDHCIGCGLCATNCPYGNIWLVPNENRKIEAADPDHPGHTRLVAQPKAATCDLCDAEGKLDKPEPRCVYACPHDAAHRMTGEELLREVTGLASGD